MTRGTMTTDKECTKCHLSFPLSGFHRRSGRRGQSICKLCRRAMDLTRRLEDPDKWRERVAAWRRLNKPRLAKKQADRRSSIPGENAMYAKRWRDSNPEKSRQVTKNYVATHPEMLVQFRHARRSRKASAGQSFTAKEWISLKERYEYTCLNCLQSEPSIILVPDHVVPLFRGGSGIISNIQPLCRRCNSVKHTKILDLRPKWAKEHPERFVGKIGRLNFFNLDCDIEDPHVIVKETEE